MPKTKEFKKAARGGLSGTSAAKAAPAAKAGAARADGAKKSDQSQKRKKSVRQNLKPAIDRFVTWSARAKSPGGGGAGGNAVNAVYLGLSRKYKIAKFCAAFMLTFFVCGMLIANRNELTFENFQYLIKHLDVDSTVFNSSDTVMRITYPSDKKVNFDSYNGDFVVASSTSLKLYSLTGNNMLNETLYMSNPAVKPSAKYLLAYDIGGNSYSVCNTFSKLYGENLQYPITGAANSDSGMYALITRTDEYRSAVYIYNKDFKQVSRILKDKMIMDIDIKNDGSELLIVSTYDSSGQFNTEIMACPPQSDVQKFSVTLQDLFPLKAAYNSYDGFTVLCDDRLLFFNSDGDAINTYTYNSVLPIYSNLENDMSFLIFPNNVVGNAHTIIAFNEKGEKLFEKEIDGEIFKVVSGQKYFYALSSFNIIRIDRETGETSTYNIEKNSMDIVLVNDSTLFVCYSGKAVAINTNKAFDREILPAVPQTLPSAGENEGSKINDTGNDGNDGNNENNGNNESNESNENDGAATKEIEYSGIVPDIADSVTETETEAENTTLPSAESTGPDSENDPVNYGEEITSQPEETGKAPAETEAVDINIPNLDETAATDEP